MKYSVDYRGPTIPAQMALCLSTRTQHYSNGANCGSYEIATLILCHNGQIRYSEFGFMAYDDLELVIRVIKELDQQNNFI